jgi:hypothetical protein
MLYGEAHGQAEIGDSVSEPAIGVTIRNRFNDTTYFSGSTNYQNTITSGQFKSIKTCQADGSCVANGSTPELSVASDLFTGTISVDIQHAQCFFSPTPNDWIAIQAALPPNPPTTTIPTVYQDPGCYPRNLRQFIYSFDRTERQRNERASLHLCSGAQRVRSSRHPDQLIKGTIMRTQLSALFLVVGLFQGPNGQVPSAGQRADVHEQRRQTYSELQQQIFARTDTTAEARDLVHSTPQVKVDEITSHLHSLIAAEVEDTLAGANVSTRDVVQSIQNMLGEMSLSNWDKQVTNTPFAEFIDLSAAKVLAAAYGMLRGSGAIPNSHSYLEFYTSQNGAWQLKAQADLDFDGCSFFVSRMDAGLAGQAWYLAWGKTVGDPSGAMQARLYSFDGTSVKQIWRRDDLWSGVITMSKKSVTLVYDKQYHSTERVRETLYITPDGLK